MKVRSSRSLSQPVVLLQQDSSRFVLQEVPELDDEYTVSSSDFLMRLLVTLDSVTKLSISSDSNLERAFSKEADFDLIRVVEGIAFEV